MKKGIILMCLHCFILSCIVGQTVWHDPMKTDSYIIRNQAFTSEIGRSYARLPVRAKDRVRSPVWELSRYSSGLCIHFQSNASHIKIRYGVTGPHGMPHMPPTGVSGIDMYRIEEHKWDYCSGTYTFSDTILYDYDDLLTAGLPSEYCVFLPLYNEVAWMEIGVEKGDEFYFRPKLDKKPIVVYGTSIAQGACASRPGMAWGNIIQRYVDCPVINLGFSGNGKLEKEVLEFINEIDACLYILDCVSNLTKDTLIREHTVQAVRQIRNCHKNTPVWIMEHAGYSNSKTNLSRQLECRSANMGTQQAYNDLLVEGVKNIDYISKEDFDFPDDAWVDYVHPSDIGMRQKALVVKSKLLHLCE
jgi:hypothetical protein